MAVRISERSKDRIATALIRTGGVLVILVVVGIVVNIGAEALPLFRDATAGPVERFATSGLVAGSDPRREALWVLGRDGIIRFATGGHEAVSVAGESGARLAAADLEIHGLVSAIDEGGRAVVGRLRFRDTWEDSERRTSASWRPAAEALDLGPAAWSGVTANAADDGSLLLAAWAADGQLVLANWDADTEAWAPLPTPADLGPVAGAAVAPGLGAVALVARSGALGMFRGPALEPMVTTGLEAPVTAARFLIGGGSLVVAGSDGSVTVLLEVPRVEVENRGSRPLQAAGTVIGAGEAAVVADDEVGRRLAARPDVVLTPAPPQWTAVRRLEAMPARPTTIAPADRRRDFAVGAADGTVALYHSTSGRRLLVDRWSLEPVRSLAIDPKGDGAVMVSAGEVLRRTISNPHPEISFRTLFLPVWYEAHAAPRWVWQSTGGSDAFEPKLSVWPLVFGTLKATLYAMVLSVPLALMAAVYVSQLAPSWLQSLVKPTLELMAAVPSVVVGFLAALWLAPRLEGALLAVLLAACSLPLAITLAVGLWRLVPSPLRRALPEGSELAMLVVAAATVVTVAAVAAGPLESRLFGGDLQRFLFTEWGILYDQRNSIVVGIALGFAVIPIIFTIAEDACSSVPRALVNASRALGATRWQTAIKMVVPAASPGLFAAVMLGLGRAVGETMIVLMAAGNTPVLDLSLFNGMRTMSAAIAVEIPEAPVGDTLFRVLFLTGTLLFLFTFALTTVADAVGRHLRKRYARF